MLDRKLSVRALLASLGRPMRGAVLGAAIIPAGSAAGQQAYYSLTGSLSATDATQGFTVDYSRAVTAVDNPQFRTFHNAGGTNAAGTIIAAGSFDPLLNLDDVFGGSVSVTNDDGGTGLDAFLAYPGNGNTGTTLTGLTLNGLHNLTLQKFSAGSAGPWAVDLLGPADATTLWTPVASANSSIDSLIFGSNGTEGTTPAVVDLNASLPATITGPLYVAKSGKGLLTKSTSAGDFTVQGLTMIGAGGDAVINLGTFNADGGITLETKTLTAFDGGTFAINNSAVVTVGAPLRVEFGAAFNLNSGDLNANDDIEIDGGTFTALVDGITQAAGKSITVRNNGQFNHDPAYRVNLGQSFIVESGGDASFKGSFGLATNGNGTIRATGAGSTFAIDSGFNTFWGTGGNNATVEVFDQASAMIDFAGGIDFARSTNASNNSVITVNSGGDLTFANTRLTLAEDNSASTVTVTVDGAGSTFTQTGNKELIIGGTGPGTATVNVLNSGVLTTGTAQTTVAGTGQINVTNGGLLVTNGNLAINGGSVIVDANSAIDPGAGILVDAGTFDAGVLPGTFLNPGQTLTALNNAQVMTNGSGASALKIDGGQSFSILSGSDYTHTGSAFVGTSNGAGTLTVDGTGTTLNVTSALTIADGSGTGTVNFQGNSRPTVTGLINLANNATTSTTNATLNITSLARLTLNGNLLVGNNDGDRGTATVNVDGTDTFLNQFGSTSFILGNADTPGNGGVHTINVINDGNFNVGTGTSTVNKTGTLNVNTSGYFQISGGLNVVGGTINNAGGGGNGSFDGLTLFSGATLTASDEATLNFTSAYNLNNGATVQITDGADWTITSRLVMASTGDATVIVDGAGSTLMLNTLTQYPSESLLMGFLPGYTGTLTVRNGGHIGAANAPTLLSVTGTATTQHLNVESGGTYDAAGISLATLNGGSATVTVTGTGSMILQELASTLTVGSAGTSSAAIIVSQQGRFDTGTGLTTINPTGSLDINTGGVFNANGDVNVNGGSITTDNGTAFKLIGSGTLTATNDAQINFNGPRYSLRFNSTFKILSGSDFVTASGLDVGTQTTPGTLVVDGLGSTLDVNGGTVFAGASGGNASITIRNQATAEFDNTINLANLNDNSIGAIHIESGATVTAMQLLLGADTFGPAADVHATLNVTGDGTTLTQGGTSTLVIGGSGAGSTALLSVTDQAVVNTGTATTTIAPTGTLSVNTAGVFNANGPLNVVGGAIQNTGLGQTDGLVLNSATTLTASAQANLSFTGPYSVHNGSTINITDGADWSLSGTLDIGVLSNGTVVVEGAGSTMPANTANLASDGLRIGSAGHTGQLTIRSGGEGGAFNGRLKIADSAVAGTVGQVTVASGGKLNAQGISMATQDAGTATLTLTGTGTQLYQNGATGFTIGSSGTSSATVTVADDATVITGTGLLTVNPTGSVVVNSNGRFNASGLVNNIAGGSVSINDAGSRFNLVAGGTVNVTNGGQFNFNGDRYAVQDNRTFNILSGSDFFNANGLEVGANTTGTVLVDGPGSSLDTNGGAVWIGRVGGNGLLTIRNQSGANLSGPLYIANNQAVGTVNIESGAVVNTSSISIAELSDAGAVGTLNISGAGTTVTTSPTGVIRLGNSVLVGASTPTINLFNNATLTTSFVVINPDGVFNLLNGSLVTNGMTQNGMFNFQAGSLSVGQFGGTLDQQGGTLKAGPDDVGFAYIIGDYNLIAGTVQIGIGGPVLRSDYDQVDVENTATLAGTLDLSLTGGFLPSPYQSFTVLTSGARVGRFDQVAGVQYTPGRGLAVTYVGGDVVVTEAILGDADLDGDVDDADLGAAFSNYAGPGGGGKHWALGDFDGDGDVDDSDLGTAFAGYTGPLGPAVPEPASLVMLALGGALLGRRRRA